MRNLLLVSLIILILPATSVIANSAQAPDIAGHKLVIELIPDNKRIVAEDLVTLTAPATGDFSFSLNKNLNITSLTYGTHPLTYDIGPFVGEDESETGITDNFNEITAHLPKGAMGFTVKYEGEIYDPIEPSKAMGRTRGDFTSGIISGDGIFLSSESGWYADTREAMATFNIKVTLPPGWLAVTQGDLLDEFSTDNGNTSVWGCDVPFDGCVLVANKYFKRTRNIDGVDCSTYFYRDIPELSDSFLDKIEEYLPAYQKLFGPFPYSRFDIVENFFSTGYGMPGYTLLGSMVLTMPYATAEGSLAHEMVHCWWGNYVFPDWDTGNWCEGLTYYSTNYYWNFLSGHEERLEEFRYADMLKYTLEVKEKDEYPVREFRTKWTAVDGDIGYGKASMIFGMLHRIFGDKIFFNSLQLVIQRNGGKKTTWDDFRIAFEDVSGHDLKDFFNTWLDNKGTPKLKFDSVSVEEKYGSYRVKTRISQEGEPFYMLLPVVVKTGKDEQRGLVEIYKDPVVYDIDCDAKPVSIELDPDYIIFRRLERPEVKPCLSATMSADSILVIIPSGGENDELEVMNFMGPIPGKKKVNVKAHYGELAKSITEDWTEARVKYDKDVTDSDLANNSILCLGAPRYNSIALKPATAATEKTNTGFGINDSGFTVNGTDYNDDNQSLLVTTRNPYNSDYDITFYMGNSPQAVFKASYIFFYTLYSYVVYADGTPVTRGNWERGKGSLYHEFS